MKYENKTSFPIIPVINGYVEEGEEITVITVVADYENTLENYEALKMEIKK